MSTARSRYASLSEVHPDFAPLVPTLNEAFERIWTPGDIAQLRKNFKSSRSPIPGIPNDGFAISHRMVPVSDGHDVEIRIYRPTPAHVQGLSPMPLLFIAHGGGVRYRSFPVAFRHFPVLGRGFERCADSGPVLGWVVGDHESEGALSRLICVQNRLVVVSVDYRRAPEHPFPIPFNDTYDAYKWTVLHATELGIDANTIVLGGTSAGANIAAALALKLRDDNALDGVVGQLLNIPVLCHPRFFPHGDHELQSYQQNARSPTINGERMRWFWDQYFPNATPDTLASPLLAPRFDGLPPALIQVAGMDPLRDEGLAYAQELKEAGVAVEIRIHAGVPHGFVFATKLACTKAYFQCMVKWIAGILGREEPSYATN